MSDEREWAFGRYHTCEECGKEFYVGCTMTDYIYKEGHKWFCSYKCHTKYITHICKQCGKQYDAWKNHRGFCSQACKQKYYKKMEEIR